jgi:hypothetical protein
MDGLSAGRAAVGWSVVRLTRGPILVPTLILVRIVALVLGLILAPAPDRIATDARGGCGLLLRAST